MTGRGDVGNAVMSRGSPVSLCDSVVVAIQRECLTALSFRLEGGPGSAVQRLIRFSISGGTAATFIVRLESQNAAKSEIG